MKKLLNKLIREEQKAIKAMIHDDGFAAMYIFAHENEDYLDWAACDGADKGEGWKAVGYLQIENGKIEYLELT